MRTERQQSIDRMVVLAHRLNQIVVQMQIRKAQLLARPSSSENEKSA